MYDTSQDEYYPPEPPDEPNRCPKCGEDEPCCGFCLHANVPEELEPCKSCIDTPNKPNWECDCGHEEKVSDDDG